LVEAVSRKFPRFEGRDGFFLELLIDGWRQENYSRYGEESLRHPKFVWFW